MTADTALNPSEGEAVKRLTRFVCSPVIGLIVLLAQQPGKAQGTAPDALTFFKNYFVTGGSKSGFVDLAPKAAATVRSQASSR